MINNDIWVEEKIAVKYLSIHTQRYMGMGRLNIARVRKCSKCGEFLLSSSRLMERTYR